MQQIIHILNQNHLLNQTSVTQYCSISYQRKLYTETTLSSQQRFQVQCSPSADQEKVKIIKQSLDKLQLQIQFSQQLGQGQTMPSYKSLHKVFSEEQVQLTHQPGQVLLVDVWATWCGPCQNPMKHNQQMLQKNQEKWKGKVRIVAVSVDQTKQAIQNRVNTKGWNKIQHLTLLGWNGDHSLIKDFQIQGIPFIFLVDKQGKIDFTGHPSSIKLEERINELIQKGDQPNLNKITNAENHLQSINEQITKKHSLKKLFFKQLLDGKFDKAELFNVSGVSKVNVVKGIVQPSKTKFQVSVYENTPELINDFKYLAKDTDPSTYEIEQNLVKFVNVPQVENPECVQCKTKLSYPFYWCKWDPNPNSLRCRNCIEKKSEIQGKHFSYEQNSLLLGGTCKKIAVKGIGNNIQPKDIKQVTQPHHFGCNGCGSSPENIGQERYICLGCRNDPNPKGDYIDICSQCFRGYFNGNEEVRQRLNSEGHRQDHPLLRLLYNVEGYYTY